MGSLTHTVGGSDNLVNFKSAARVPIESLKTYFKPKQDLHGYDRPWPAGGGKNLISDNLITNKTINESGEIINNSGGRISDYISVSSVSYVWSGTNNYSSSWNYRVHGYDENKDWVEQISRTYVNGNAAYNIVFTPSTNIKYVRLSFVGLAENNQLEQGSTATSYEPYSNICPIEGWNSCATYKAGKNIGHVVGYSARSTESPTGIKYADGNYGNSLSTINYTYPDTPVTITQTQWPNVSSITNYRNGYCTIIIDNLIFGQRYDFSFKVSNITNNPLNVSISQIDITGPSGNNYSAPSEIINEDTLVFRNVAFNSHDMYQNRSEVNIYYCGMSFTLSEFMVTPANMSDGVFEPYCGDIIPVTFPVTGKNRYYYDQDNIETDLTLSNGSVRCVYHTGVISDGRKISISGTAIDANTVSDSSYNVGYIQDDVVYALENFIVYTNGSLTNRTLTVPNGCEFVIIGTDNSSYAMNKNITRYNIQIEYGNEPTAYEPYSSDNTIYGGYVDVAAGEIVAEWYKYVVTGSETWSLGGNNVWPQVYVPSGKQAFDYTSGYCSHSLYKPFTRGHIGVMYNERTLVFDPDLGGIDFWQQYCTDQYNNGTPVYVVYKLKTPIHYPIPKQQLNTYLNNNSVWSNTNDVTEVSYALHDTGPIRASKRRIAMNQPHIETASGSIANFRTDVSAPLKEYKVTFMPVQSGTGDPSPSNVRPIIGWNGVNVHHSGKSIVQFKTSQKTTSIYYNGYNGWCDKIDATSLPAGSTLTYSAHIDATNSDANYDRRVRIWAWLKAGGYHIISGDNIPIGSSGISSVSIQITDAYQWVAFGLSMGSGTIASYPMVTVGESLLDYEPCSDEVTSIIFPASGKNYFNADTTSKTDKGMTWTANNDHTITVSGTPTDYTYIMTGMFEIPTSGKICLSGLDGVTNVAWDNYYIYNSSKTLLRCTGGGGNGYKVINLDDYDDPKYMILAFKRSSNNVKVSGTIKPQVEIGETPTAYEPYTTTIYGGYVDVAAGELVAEWEYASARWGDIKIPNYHSNDTGFYEGYLVTKHAPIQIIGKSQYGVDVYCNVIGRVMWEGVAYTPEHFYFPGPNYYKANISGNWDDNQIIEMVFRLNEPIHYQLTPHQLKTLRGTNNIWSDANGNVEVKYWKH